MKERIHFLLIGMAYLACKAEKDVHSAVIIHNAQGFNQECNV